MISINDITEIGKKVIDDVYKRPVAPETLEVVCYTVQQIIKRATEFENTLPEDYWANVTAIKNKQTAKGIESYGQRLEDNHDLSFTDRLTYLEEELVDSLMYIEGIKAHSLGYNPYQE